MSATKTLALLLALSACTAACDRSAQSGGGADGLKVKMALVNDDGVGKSIGSIVIREGETGIVLKPDLKGLPPGPHGFHVHQEPDCGPSLKDGKMAAANSAGEHFDPGATGKHAGPDGEGHAGDLPRIDVAQNGTVTADIAAPRLKLGDVKGRSLMIHEGADDFAGSPGGPRIACGVIPS